MEFWALDSCEDLMHLNANFLLPIVHCDIVLFASFYPWNSCGVFLGCFLVGFLFFWVVFALIICKFFISLTSLIRNNHVLQDFCLWVDNSTTGGVVYINDHGISYWMILMRFSYSSGFLLYSSILISFFLFPI